MAFDLSIPDPDQTKAEVEAELAVEPAQSEAIDSKAAERGAEIMKVDFESIDQRREILQAVENLGSDISKQSAAKNEMLSRRMA